MKTRNLFLAALCLILVVFGATQLFAAVTENSTDVPKAIPDAGATTSTLNFSVNGTITDANVTIGITHTWNDDLDISLASPSIAAQVLLNDCAGSGDNIAATLDNDAAGLAACTAGATIAGTIQPTSGTAAPAPAAGSMNAFDASTSAGVWTLTVTDDSAGCIGTVTSWSLTLDGAPPLPVELMSFEIN
jgi:subtilisin-like proprotein convertase family protein